MYNLGYCAEIWYATLCR